MYRETGRVQIRKGYLVSKREESKEEIPSGHLLVPNIVQATCSRWKRVCASVTSKYLTLSEPGRSQSKSGRQAPAGAAQSSSTHLEPRNIRFSICQDISGLIIIQSPVPSDAIKHSISLYQVLTTINARGERCF